MRMRGWVSGIVLVASAWPAVAPGVDGVIEINQAAAEQGGIPGDAAGFPVSLTETGSYRLTGNLDVPADSTGIEITAPDVTLDLNGFSIRGAASCPGDPPAACTGTAGRGIHATAPGSRVSGGFVTGFSDGGVSLGDSSRVSAVEARRNGRVGIEVGARGRIRDSHASANAGVGLSASLDGSVLDSMSLRNGDTAVILGLGAGLASSVLASDGQTLVRGGVLLGGNACNAEATCTQACTDVDGDAFFGDCLPSDCDDSESASFPGNPEICDGIDNDCNGLVDDDCDPGSFSIDFCKLHFPLDASASIDQTTTFLGRVLAAGLTDQGPGIDADPGLVASVGAGPDGTDPATDPGWFWLQASPNAAWDGAAAGEPNNDEYEADLSVSTGGVLDVAYRFSADGGLSWTYCDRGPAGSSDGYTPSTAGSLIVGECTDLAAPGGECAGLQCTPDSAGSAFCAPPAGVGGQGATCSTAGDCAPGLGCLDAGGLQCLEWCRVPTGAECSFGSCFSLTPSLLVGAVEWGVCL